jgi:hypothetical protein
MTPMTPGWYWWRQGEQFEWQVVHVLGLGRVYLMGVSRGLLDSEIGGIWGPRIELPAAGGEA